MTAKSARVITSLVAVALTVGALPAFADKQHVETAERSVADFAKRNGTNHRMYGAQLANLCNVYIANEMFDKAAETFNKAVEVQKSNDKSNIELPGFHSTYAMSLYQASAKAGINKKTQQMLRERAKKVMDTGLAIANQFPPTSSQKQYYLLATIEGYRIAGMKAEEQAQIKTFEPDLKTLESNNKLTAQDIIQVAMTLTRISGLYCPAPAFRAARMMQPFQVVPDGSPDKPQTVKVSDFKNAEDYQLRALAMYNKLPENNPTRVEAQRSIVHWYHLYGQTKQEELQTQQLSKLMHTTDRDKLFPQPAPCPACGMG